MSTLTGDAADLILRDGRIHTFDRSGHVTDALAVRDGRIIAIGGDVASLRSRVTINLDGRTVIPGINDAHLHAAWLGARWPHLFFSDTPPSDEPQGRLVSDEPERRAALLHAWELLGRLGITSYTEPGVGPGEDAGETGCFGTDMLRTYVDLHREGRQTARVTMLRLFGTIDGESTLDDFERGVRMPPPPTDPEWLAITGVKIFADGIPPMATAWVNEPYRDGSSGALLTHGGSDPLAAYHRMITLAASRGLQVAVHATGDRSIEEFLRALEALGPVPEPPGPHYVVHGDLATPEQLKRMQHVGAGFAVQPLIAAHTHAWASAQLGPARVQQAWPLAEMISAGVLTTITSDAPIATPDWRLSADASLDLLSATGVADSAESRRALMQRMTVDPAIQDGASTWKGRLAAGMVADLTVLDEDPLEAGRPMASIRVARTVVGGRTVFESDGHSAT